MAKDKDANIVNLKAERERLEAQVKEKNNLEDLTTSIVIHGNRIKEEATNDLLRRMNTAHAFVRYVGGKPMVMTYVYSDRYKKEIIEYITPESISVMYANELAEGFTPTGKDKTLTVGKWWLAHPYRKDYQTVTFEPDRAPGEYQAENGKLYFNEWEGFSVPPKKGSWKLTKKHIWKILCNQDRKKFKYFMRWLAWAVQNPGKRAEVAVIFKGKKGAGKGFIFTQMVELFGRHGMSIANREHLTGKHNAHLQNLSFLFADEAYYPGDKEVEGILKNIITEPTLTTEPKFQNVKLSINCLHISMATNSDWVIPATEDERRYFINKVNENYAKGSVDDKTREIYFSKLWGEMNQVGLSAMLYDLQHIKLRDWHPRSNIPMTRELIHQIEMSLPPIKRAMLALLEDGMFPGSVKGDKGYVISNSNLLKHFHSLDPRYKNINIKQLTVLCDELGLERGRTGAGRFYNFPELGELRTTWNKLSNSNVDWSLTDTWYVATKDYGI